MLLAHAHVHVQVIKMYVYTTCSYTTCSGTALVAQLVDRSVIGSKFNQRLYTFVHVHVPRKPQRWNLCCVVLFCLSQVSTSYVYT